MIHSPRFGGGFFYLLLFRSSFASFSLLSHFYFTSGEVKLHSCSAYQSAYDRVHQSAKIRSFCTTPKETKHPGNLESSGVFDGTPDAIRTHDLQSRRLATVSAFFVVCSGCFAYAFSVCISFRIFNRLFSI